MAPAKNKLFEKDKQVYLNGIQKFITRGVPVYIDGVPAEECGLEQLLSPPQGTFYMADFVMEEYRDAGNADEDTLSMVRESADGSGCYTSLPGQERFYLKEIRFDLVYHY